MNECDTLLMVGSSFPYAEFLPKEGQARGVQIDIDPRMINIRYPMEVGLIGDTAATLRALIPLLRAKNHEPWRASIEADVQRWWQLLESRARNAAQPINPQRVFWELSPLLPDGCIIAGDSGSSTGWYARDVKIRAGMRASLSGGLATMGSGIPYAIAAKFAYPERPVLAIVGDGAMQMNGNAELVTVYKYWRTWSDPRFIVLVLNNGDLNMVSWEQRVLEGDPKFEASQNVPDFPYAQYARLLGFEGIVIDEPEAIVPAWRRAFAADRPVVLDFHTDPNVPPIPPHLTVKQLMAFAKSLRGDPDALRVVVASLVASLKESASSILK
jgi:pyruvate dehydrogenase (quinone)